MKMRSGFTLIELIVVIVCIGILAFMALPHFYNISAQANEESEAEMVGSIKTGLQLYYAQRMVNAGNGAYPGSLDTASAGQSSPENPFFVNVLQDPYRGNDWSKNGSGEYTGPAGNSYRYDSNTGRFTPLQD